MKAGGIELTFTVSARELDNVRSMLSSKQLFRNFPVMISLYFSVILIVLFLFSWIARLLVWIPWLPVRDDLAHLGREGVHWGAQQMIAGPEDLTLRRAAHTAVYGWAAIHGLRTTRTMILLMLTSMHTIPVPRRAFASRTDERRFCDFVRDRIANTAMSSQESVSTAYRCT